VRCAGELRRGWKQCGIEDGEERSALLQREMNDCDEGGVGRGLIREKMDRMGERGGAISRIMYFHACLRFEFYIRSLVGNLLRLVDWLSRFCW